MVIYTLYESGTTDGYTTSGDGLFFLSESDAEAESNSKKNAGHGRVITHTSMIKIDDAYYKINPRPIYLACSLKDRQEKKKELLNTLSTEEKQLLLEDFVTGAEYEKYIKRMNYDR